MTDMVMECGFRGTKFYFSNTLSAPGMVQEIFGDNYKILEKGVTFDPGDIIFDIGANEGMFSILMSKLFPQTRIISLEPIPKTYQTLVDNVRLNKCENISHYNIGVGKKGQKTAIMNVSKDYSGGSTAMCTYNAEDHDQVEVGMIGLDEAFELYGIDRCRLLKIDVEGQEYEVLYSSTVLPRVDSLVAEIHWNHRIEHCGWRPDGLVNWISNRTKVLHIQMINMAE
jgi:FkbM family methyltransferase